MAYFLLRQHLGEEVLRVHFEQVAAPGYKR
jgi:hypothetical protein